MNNFPPKVDGPTANKNQQTKSNVTSLTAFILITFYHPLPYLKTPKRVPRPFVHQMYKTRKSICLRQHHGDSGSQGIDSNLSTDNNQRSVITPCYPSKNPQLKVYSLYLLGSKLPLFPYNRGWSST